MTQQEKLEEILELKKENPKLPIKFFVDNEAINDLYRYSEYYISKVVISDWLEFDDGETIYTDEDSAKDAIIDDVMFDTASEDEREKKINEYWDENVQEVILIIMTA